MKALRWFARQSPALIVAMIALFVALTGTAVATTSALITGAQIKNNSITGLDVKNRSLTPGASEGPSVARAALPDHPAQQGPPAHRAHKVRPVRPPTIVLEGQSTRAVPPTARAGRS